MNTTGPGWPSRLRRLSLNGALVVALIALRAASATAADVTKLNVGLSSAGNTSLAMFMAQAGGFYAERGLEVDMRVFDAGSRGAAEVQAGRIDAMHVGLSAVIELNRAGADLRLIASLVNVQRFSLYVAPDIATAADLKGGVMAVSGFGSESDSTMRLALSRLGLKPSDVVFKEFSSTASRMAAIKSGAAKAAMLAEPISAVAREQGLKLMLDLAAERIPWVYSAVAVRRGDLAGRRALLKGFLQAIVEGAYLGRADPTRAKEVLAKIAKITDPAILAGSYDEFRTETPPMLEVTGQEAANVLAQFPGGSQRIEDYIDASLINKLKQEGFFGAMARKYGAR